MKNLIEDYSFDLYLRGLEIKQWLIDNNYTNDYIIIDDCKEILPEQKKYFVKCNSAIGFNEERLNYALTI